MTREGIVFLSEKICVLLIKQTQQLAKSNQQLVEALISKNAIDYALAQKMIKEMERPVVPEQPQSMQQELDKLVDHEADILADPVEE